MILGETRRRSYLYFLEVMVGVGMVDPVPRQQLQSFRIPQKLHHLQNPQNRLQNPQDRLGQENLEGDNS
jgi:hypothetical protein